jgi:hypothetical protein
MRYITINGRRVYIAFNRDGSVYGKYVQSGGQVRAVR